jgi:hypothetical protein
MKTNTGPVLPPAQQATTARSVSVTTTVDYASSTRNKMSNKDIESAVYSHIQAVRALGRTQVNTAEIAAALRLRAEVVLRTIHALEGKGVKVLR